MMLKTLTLSAAGWLLLAGIVRAQETPALYKVVPAEEAVLQSKSNDASEVIVESTTRPRTAKPGSWSQIEYLMWWIRNAPIGVPLLTANNNPAFIGALNDPGTRIIYGAGSNRHDNFGTFSGIRASDGGWLDSDVPFGFERSGFLLERRSMFFTAFSPGGAAPIVSVPFNATQPFAGNPPGETALNAGTAPTLATIQLTSRMWGAEVNGLADFLSDERFCWSGLLGFRYLDLQENLTLTYQNLDPATLGTISVIDGFGTRNQIYAGQVGTRIAFVSERFTTDLVGKVGFGSSHQVINVAGATNITNAAFGFATGSTPAGTFAQPSNIGPHSRTMFTVIPEVQVKFGVAITQSFHVFATYNYLQITNVLRPGNQIDRNLNVTQQPVFVPPGTLAGPAAPVQAFRATEFSAHGVSLGMELRY